MTLRLLALPPVQQASAGDLTALLAEHGTVLYVALAVLVVGLVALTAAATNQADEAGQRRDRQRKQAILMLVRQRATLTPEQVAAEQQLDLMHAARLLVELEREGLVTSSGREPVQYRRVESKVRGV
ncbi:MAG: hypothetical protein RL199_1725 [Pseudomonadota bacterium]|jgi:hypothetical protein